MDLPPPSHIDALSAIAIMRASAAARAPFRARDRTQILILGTFAVLPGRCKGRRRETQSLSFNYISWRAP